MFVLAATGLLDGRRATTHWRYSERLARAYPDIGVVPDVLYVDEGNVLTAAGSAAGIDLSLHLIRRDWGPAAANSVARRLVVPLAPRRRPGAVHRGAGAGGAGKGGASARCSSACAPSPRRDTTHRRRWHATAGMSRRTFLRRFKASTGTTPGAWLANARLARARELLKYPAHDIEEIATAAGFGSAATLRHHFRKQVKVSPSALPPAIRDAASRHRRPSPERTHARSASISVKLATGPMPQLSTVSRVRPARLPQMRPCLSPARACPRLSRMSFA